MKQKMKLFLKLLNEVKQMPNNNEPTYQNEAYFMQIIDLLQQILAAISGTEGESK